MDKLSKPALYGVNDEGQVMLKGMRCACGRIAFPLQGFGCEQCGRSENLAPLALRATGTLAAAIQVHLHPAAFPKAPFALGAVKLDDGPMVRTLLADADMRPGTRVVGELATSVGEDGEPSLDLRFTTANP